MEKTTKGLATLSLEELEQVAGSKWIKRRGRWIWIPNGRPRNGVNNPPRSSDGAN